MTSPLVALAVLLATAFATGPQTDNLIAPDLEPGGTFFDDDGSTHEGYIEALAAIDVLRGCNPPLSDFTCPADPITRGQMAALLRRSLRLPPASGDAFDDDDGSTFEEDINRVAAAGITRGCDAAHARLFCPDEFVTRGQMAAFLNRGFDLPPSKVDRFSDDDRSTFEKDIDRVASAGITEGCDPDYPRRFCPLELVTRGQMASFLGRALGVDALRPAERPAFTLAVTGDILIHSPLVDRAAVYGDSSGQPYDFRPMFERIAPIIASADLALCHLEVPLSADNEGLSGYPLFNAPREVAQAIASAGYEGCSTASNHSIDQGVQGAAETLDVLDAAGVGHAGTARNPEEAANPRLYQVGDVTVGHLSYTYWLNGLSPPSGQEWVANVIDQSAILAEAAQARAEGADLVVVSLHWGVEYQSDPDVLTAVAGPGPARVGCDRSDRRSPRPRRPAHRQGRGAPCRLRTGQSRIQPVLPRNPGRRDRRGGDGPPRRELVGRQAHSLRPHQGGPRWLRGPPHHGDPGIGVVFMAQVRVGGLPCPNRRHHPSFRNRGRASLKWTGLVPH